VPQKIVAQRHDKDKEIQMEVAVQMIQAVCVGGLMRHRQRRAKLEAQKRLRRAVALTRSQTSFLGGNARDRVNLKLRADLAPLQDENAKEKNLWIFTESPDTGPLKMMLCKIAKYELATGSKLANIAYEQVHVTRV
jgi:hypothetical protein